MWIRVHYCDVIVLNTHDIIHVIILPIEIFHTTLFALHNTFNNHFITRGLCTFQVLFIIETKTWNMSPKQLCSQERVVLSGFAFNAGTYFCIFRIYIETIIILFKTFL